MRQFLHVSWLVTATVLLACSQRNAEPNPSDGLLVLEVGGEQSSLRQALLAAGVAVSPAAPRKVRLDDAADSVRDPIDPATTEPPQVVAPAADHIVVALGRRQTLIHLAKQHLGNGNRFREILAYNNWSEADARRLPEGQQVKIPLDRPPASARR